LIVLAIGFAFLRGAHFANAKLGIGFADSYWTQFWLTNYQDGYLRRSLLGTLVALVLPAGSSVAILSAVHLTISAALLAVGMVIVWRQMYAASSARSAVLCTALFGFSPVGPMLFETTGDPLQSAMLVWLAGLFGGARLSKVGSNEGARLVLLVTACIIAMLIHEAMAFFVLPHLVLTAPRLRLLAVHRRMIVAVLAVVLAAAAIGLLSSNSAGVPRYFFTNAIDHTPIVADRLATPGFAQVFRQEMHESFRTPMEGLRRLARLLCFPVVPLALIAFMATFVRQRIQLALLFAIWLVCAGPLFVIAHDWGRFGVLTLFLVSATALADGLRLNLDKPSAMLERAWDAALKRLIRSSRELAIVRAVLAVIILASSVIWEDYRVVGGRMSLFLAVPVLLFAVWVFIARGKVGCSSPLV
jgi:hypothetical protein